MSNFRKTTRLKPTQYLETSFLTALTMSERLYGVPYVSTPLYIYSLVEFVCSKPAPRAMKQRFDGELFNFKIVLHPAVRGLSQLGIDMELVDTNIERLMPKTAEDTPDGLSDEFTAVRNEALRLAEEMGEQYFDIGHMILAAMRETEIFHGVDKSLIRQYKAEYCKLENLRKHLGECRARIEQIFPLLEEMNQMGDSESFLPHLDNGESIPYEELSPKVKAYIQLWQKIMQLLIS